MTSECLDKRHGRLFRDVNFAPFLMWSDTEKKYFETLGKVNKQALSDRNEYATPKTCESDNYAELLREAFFSQANIDLIQARVIQRAYVETERKVRLRPQKYEHLVQLMNQVFQAHCRFLPYKLREQIADLNERVADFLVPLLLKEIVYHVNYLRDSDRAALTIMDRPQHVSSAGSRTLPSYLK